MNKDLVIANVTIRPGEKRKVDIPVAKLYTDTQLSIPVHVHRLARKVQQCLLARRFTVMS